ncbi:hypothetical protein BDP27DRAFT_1232815, partial [Rhodocollybia butyracea]
PYEVTLKPLSLQWKTLSRRFISRTYGGSETMTSPTISQKNRDKHGRESWIFWNMNNHPNALCEPRKPGVWYNSNFMAEVFSGAQHCFARISSDKWLYVWDYTMHLTEPLTQWEWLKQDPKFHRSWVRVVQKKNWGGRVRAAIHLRNILGRELTKEKVYPENEGGKFDD